MAIAKNLSFYMNGVSLAEAINSFSPDATVEIIDATAIAHTYRVKEIGFKNGMMSGSGYFKYDQTNLDEIHNVMSAAFAAGTESVVTASLEALAVGGVAIMLNPTQQSYSITTPLGQAISNNFNLESNNGINFGKWMFNAEVDTTTTNGTSVDNAAATANGGLFQVHYQNGAGAEDLTAKIQHSTDNSVWADLGTITVSNITGFGASSLAIAAGTTVNRYTRAQIAVASGALNVQAAFARR
jgi:hypothetical protein